MTNQLLETRYDQDGCVTEDFFTQAEADRICETEDALGTLLGHTSNAYTTQLQDFVENTFGRSVDAWTGWAREWL